MFVDKEQLVAMHEGEFESWERLLSNLSDEQVTGERLRDGLSIKDTMAHLGAWQARTIARLDAALHGHEPQFPRWGVDLDAAESSAAVDRANAWILETNRDRSWAEVRQNWREGFLRFLELVRQIPEVELLPGAKLAWMAEYQPLEGYAGTYDYHHAEHRMWLEEWLRESER